MVDVHQREGTSGLSDERVWSSLSKWGICWRVTLTTATVGMLGVLLIGLAWLTDSRTPNGFFGPTGLIFGLFPAPVYGALAALFGTWLREFHSAIQSFLFGLIGFSVCAVVLLFIDGIDSALNPCPPTMGCFAPFTGALLVILFAGLPLAIMAGLGLGIAIFITNGASGRRKAFTAILVATVLVFTAAQVMDQLRFIPDFNVDEISGPICGVSQNGEVVEVPCGGPEWPSYSN